MQASVIIKISKSGLDSSFGINKEQARNKGGLLGPVVSPAVVGCGPWCPVSAFAAPAGKAEHGPCV